MVALVGLAGCLGRAGNTIEFAPAEELVSIAEVEITGQFVSWQAGGATGPLAFGAYRQISAELKFVDPLIHFWVWMGAEKVFAVSLPTGFSVASGDTPVWLGETLVIPARSPEWQARGGMRDLLLGWSKEGGLEVLWEGYFAMPVVGDSWAGKGPLPLVAKEGGEWSVRWIGADGALDVGQTQSQVPAWPWKRFFPEALVLRPEGWVALVASENGERVALVPLDGSESTEIQRPSGSTPGARVNGVGEGHLLVAWSYVVSPSGEVAEPLDEMNSKMCRWLFGATLRCQPKDTSILRTYLWGAHTQTGEWVEGRSISRATADGTWVHFRDAEGWGISPGATREAVLRLEKWCGLLLEVRDEVWCPPSNGFMFPLDLPD